jgi:polyisoprenyl-phosphate glycosyltransferase
MLKISVVVPVLNEESNIQILYERIKKTILSCNCNYEILFVDDGSYDKSLDLLKEIAAKDNNVGLISFSRNFGHQAALTAGIEHAGGDAVVLIDADLQDPPELIAVMIEKWSEGYQVVYAKRIRRYGETFFKRITASFFYRLMNYFTKIQIPLDTGDFRLMDRAVINVLCSMKERNRFIRGLVSWVGFKQIGVEYERQERMHGETKFAIRKMIEFALDGIISLSDVRLIIASYIGFFIIVLSFFIILWEMFSKFFGTGSHFNDLTLVLVAVLLVGGLQLFFGGIIGEYIRRIYDESKARPIYIIKEKINIR